ncbi:MAG TPA: hypothetical protein VNK92_01610, partial [Vicinamibacterales bacterium]|nr:hypothetical protein [Vicinamibacterales bacterium]
APVGAFSPRERLLDWWAAAVDRVAAAREPEGRRALYREMAARMEAELRRDPGSTPAAYWLVVALRGAGDAEEAWAAAQAGWLRAGLARDRGAMLRADLDRLVLQGLVRDRARRRAGGNAQEVEKLEAQLAAEWESFKARWTNR